MALGKKSKLLTVNSRIPHDVRPASCRTQQMDGSEGVQHTSFRSPHNPHAVLTSRTLRSPNVHFLSHFPTFACAVVSVEYCFSFLDLVDIYSSSWVQPKYYSLKKPLLNTPSYPAPASDLTLWSALGILVCLCSCSKCL